MEQNVIDELTPAIEQLMEALYNADCAVNNIQIGVNRLPDDSVVTINTDYGLVTLYELETV